MLETHAGTNVLMKEAESVSQQKQEVGLGSGDLMDFFFSQSRQHHYLLLEAKNSDTST